MRSYSEIEKIIDELTKGFLVSPCNDGVEISYNRDEMNEDFHNLDISALKENGFNVVMKGRKWKKIIVILTPVKKIAGQVWY